jgi:hypothetical protein
MTLNKEKQEMKITHQDFTNSDDNESLSIKPILLNESKMEMVEQESQYKLTQEIFNKLEGMEDQMLVMSKNIQDLYLTLKNLESNMEKQRLK